MARPNKTGLDYFPFDIDFFNDEKISAISGEFGIKGELACIKLLCAIYRQGYFILWDEMLRMKLIKELPGVSADLLDNIVSRLVRWGLFDKTLFDKNGILTSKGIQRRYFEITKRRVNPGENLPYLLVSAYNNRVSAYINPVSSGVSVYINPQSKEKESKVKKSESNTALACEGEIFFPIEAICEQLIANYGWIDSLYTQYRVKREEAERYLREFCGEQKLKGVEAKSKKDFLSHFVSWLKIQLQTKNQQFKPKKDEHELRKTFGTDWGASTI